jgi:membrane-associated protease RseP (regulator of RpoE activity)
MNKVLKVEFVEGGSQAESLGIRAGDVVASYDGTPVSSSGQLANVVQQAAESGKEKIAIVIFRNGSEITLEGSPGKLGLNVEEADTSMGAGGHRGDRRPDRGTASVRGEGRERGRGLDGGGARSDLGGIGVLACDGGAGHASCRGYRGLRP